MTPDSALSAIIGRLEAASLTKAVSPLGVSNSSAPQMNRSFSVRMVSLGPSSNPDRFKPTVAGLRVSNRFQIELGHRLNPNSGQTAITEALQDLHKALKYLDASGTALTQEGAIRLSSSSSEYASGGAYYIQRFSIDVVYNLTMVI